MNTNTVKPTVWFWIIAGVGLLWNLMGVMNFTSHMTMTPETLATLPEVDQQLIKDMPSWVYTIFGISVITGTLGCIGLLLRKAWAIPLFLISLIAIVIQMGYSSFGTNALELKGPSSLVLPIIVILVALALLWYARMARDREWIA